METIAVVLILFVIYILPWAIAANWRNKPNQVGFFFLNLFLNWTIVMWFVCLVIAFTGKGGKELALERAAADRQLAALEEFARNTRIDSRLNET